MSESETFRRRRPTCAEIVAAQNENLSDRCSKKANTLSCRCSGCPTDDTYPVIVSPADAALLNTAFDGHSGFLNSGTDSYWEVALGAVTGTFQIPAAGWIPAFVVVNPVLVNTPPGAWANSPFSNANWISYYANGAQPSENIDLYYRYRFNLAPSVDPNTFAVTMKFFADNQVADIIVNSVSQASQPNGAGVLPQQGLPLASDPYSTSGFGPNSFVEITLDNHWRRCDNEIVVYVKSSSPYTGFLAQNAVKAEPIGDGCDCPCHECTTAPIPDLAPCITVRWGDSPCDCLETNDVEVLCITVCNCYSNVAFGGLSIGEIAVTDAAGNPVPTLPDGTPSVEIIPSGPICFGDLGPCVDGRPTCVSREVVLYTRGAVGKKYRLSFRGICFTVCHEYQSEQCFLMELCRD